MASHCQYKERVAERKAKEGVYENKWQALRSRIMECEEDRCAAPSAKREV